MTSHGSAPPSLLNGIWFSERNLVARIIAGFAIKRYTGIPDSHLELYVGAFCRSLFECCEISILRSSERLLLWKGISVAA
jgi:hypothetical protein